MAPAVLASAVGDPHVSIRADADAVREYEHSTPEIVQQFPVRVELEDRVQLGIAAVGGESGSTAPLSDPNVARFVYGDAARRAKHPSRGQLKPAGEGAIRIRRRIDRRTGGNGRLQTGLFALGRRALSIQTQPGDRNYH